GERMLVEANGPFFRAGAPTVVYLDNIRGADGKPLAMSARAASSDRVIADADERLEQALGGAHVAGRTTSTGEETVDGKSYRNSTTPREPFDIDLFPHNLQHLANRWAQSGGGQIFAWLGMEVTPVAGGVQVVSLVEKFDKDDLLRKYD